MSLVCENRKVTLEIISKQLEYITKCVADCRSECRRSVERAKLFDLSGWLTVLPTSQDHFDPTAQEFRNALALRYRKPLLNVPSGCDGCGALFSLDHALVCRKGGLIIWRHNKVWDAVGDLCCSGVGSGCF